MTQWERDRWKVATGQNKARMQRRAAARLGIPYRLYIKVVQIRKEIARQRTMAEDILRVDRAERRAKRRDLSPEEQRKAASAASSQYIMRRYQSEPAFRAWMITKAQTRRARLLGAKITNHTSLDYIAERDGWRCHICGKKVTTNNWSVDHLIPLSKGGDHTASNLALAHRTCNSRRGAGRIHAQLRLVG